MVFDIDYNATMASRKRVLDMVTVDKSLCTSGHWLTPKFGYVERHGSGYTIV